jgi:CRISPR-associated protein Cas10/Csm1 subtype III-A
MTDELFVAGDFSGIQDYVLNVPAAGGGQARQLRSRSFYVQLAGGITAWRILQTFGRGWNALLMGGGGQFLLRVPAVAEADGKLVELRKELDLLLYFETRGELGLTLV